ncbi:hypothetical protein PR001_g21155 [Phytophthora rubi]|uniref:Tc1-like transposase DDE domain-containing protein n=2 Tax=Phytophthora rubi TaxID=129364 RepID=A0A6A3JAH1_9STRA|nr:hypothetical protein PR001_g21155 [Phytophthora rubi]
MQTIGADWELVAKHNGIPRTTARRIVVSGSPEVKQRGGSRAANIKCTPEIEAALVAYVEENCLLTLEQLKTMVWVDFGVDLSTSLSSQKLTGQLYTVKQVRVEPATCNSEVNIQKRKQFALDLLKYSAEGAFIVYYDESNYNLYCKRMQGRALKGKRAIVKLPPSKGKNLQIQCAVSTEVGLLHYETQRGSIKMEENAAFVNAVYDVAKTHPTYQQHFAGKPVVIVLDNAPVHSKTEELVREREDLVLLRLAPHSRMCNPIEGCFSVLKAAIKRFLALSHDAMLSAPRGQMTELRMQLLEQAAEVCMNCMDLRLVNKMALHCAQAVAAAKRGEPMEYGT